MAGPIRIQTAVDPRVADYVALTDAELRRRIELDGAAQDPQTVEQILQPGARDDDLVFVEAAFDGTLARLVVALAATLTAELAWSARSGARLQRTLAPPTPPHLCHIPRLRHVTQW